ncbi:MAG: cytochrome c peroxidase [Chloroflexota bacterium]
MINRTRQPIFYITTSILTIFFLALTSCANSPDPSRSAQTPALDVELQSLIRENQVTALKVSQPANTAQIELGEALFFDKILSGNRDISCATCHHPTLASVDNLPLSFGTGGVGLGPDRVRGIDREFVPRNAPELFNRGADEWEIFFWDGRVSLDVDTGGFHTPAGDVLPAGLDSMLAAQAMFPPTSRDEMRGGLIDVSGYGNELAAIHDMGTAQQEMMLIWEGLTARLLEQEGYQQLFAAAYPELAADEIGFEHAANALAAFQISAFTSVDTPWDRYLDGNTAALTPQEKRGAVLFYGKASCASCHSGSLMTDQDFYNIGVPQLGPGKTEMGLDPGRYKETNDFNDMNAFRTPPLRNVALTGPYMHSGVYATLEDAVRHHLDPLGYLNRYTGGHLDAELRETLHNDPEVIALIGENIAPELLATPELSDAEISDLTAFLYALTSPQALTANVPTQVPSGLPVND